MKNIKLITKTGNKEGKNIVVLAGVHGNEKIPVKTLEKLIPKLNIEKGKVIFIIGNLQSLKQNKRFIDFDLNRCFLKKQPKNISKSIEGQTAKKIMRFLDKADLMLDLHVSNSVKSIPFLICEKQSFQFAKYLNFKIISCNWDKFDIGSTDYYMNLQNKIGICAECGSVYNNKTRKTAENALINFLKTAGAIKGKIKKNKKQIILKIKSAYYNKNKFTKLKDFPDFIKLKKKTLIGIDGNKKIYANKNEIILFVRNSEKLNRKCFMIAKENINKSNKLNTSIKEEK